MIYKDVIIIKFATAYTEFHYDFNILESSVLVINKLLY